MTTVSELPENEKYYDVKMADGHEFVITGDVKDKMLSSQTQFITLSTGDMINKAFITRITLNKKETKDRFNSKTKTDL